MTRVVRHASELDRWEMAHGVPDPRLTPYVLRYVDYDEHTGSFVRRRELPGARVVAIMNLGAPIRVRAPGGEWATHGDGFFAGLHDTYAITETDGAQRGVQIDLTPVGARVLLRLPMYHLTGRVTGLDDLLGHAGRRLHEQLACATGCEQRFDRLDAFFLDRLDDAFSPVPSITRALTRLHATRGTVAIQALTDELGCSRRHLNDGFREHVGVSPKLLARILRFNRAVELSDGAALTWSEISLACGYYDQAHMIRDFRQFAGASPTEFARRRLPDGGGVRSD